MIQSELTSWFNWYSYDSLILGHLTPDCSSLHYFHLPHYLLVCSHSFRLPTPTRVNSVTHDTNSNPYNLISFIIWLGSDGLTSLVLNFLHHDLQLWILDLVKRCSGLSMWRLISGMCTSNWSSCGAYSSSVIHGHFRCVRVLIPWTEPCIGVPWPILADGARAGVTAKVTRDGLVK